MTFSDPAIVQMLKQDFVPVAIDQWYQRRQKDAEGEFYRKIASQGPRNDFERTTQGRYVCTPAGKLLAFNNNRGPERVRAMMKKALVEFAAESSTSTAPMEIDQLDARHQATQLPKDALVLRVTSKVLGGYEPAEDWTLAFQQAMGRDNLAFTAGEKQQLHDVIQSGGPFPEALARRIARFHLVDNTRGEPDRWQPAEIRELKMAVVKDGTITGNVHLETADGKRGYIASLFGQASIIQDAISQLDLVARGQYWGHGRYTGFAPRGKFPFAVAFRIADGSDPSDAIAPHATKGWAEGYYR